jgi:hypothetical protein
MAQSGGQISSLHLAIAAGGGVLLYAALRGVSPVAALRDITSGHPPQVSTEGKKVVRADGTIDPSWLPESEGTSDWNGVYKLNKIPKSFQTRTVFLAAANTHTSETYSQASRWARGHSDCSSFVGKSLLDIGIKPPGGSITTDYLASGDWVSVSSPQMGDVAVNGHHMAVFTDGTHGIGQQNSTSNVRRDTMDNIMANTGSWQIRRWKGWA